MRLEEEVRVRREVERRNVLLQGEIENTMRHWATTKNRDDKLVMTKEAIRLGKASNSSIGQTSSISNSDEGSEMMELRVTQNKLKGKREILESRRRSLASNKRKITRMRNKKEKDLIKQQQMLKLENQESTGSSDNSLLDESSLLSSSNLEASNPSKESKESGIIDPSDLQMSVYDEDLAVKVFLFRIECDEIT